MRAASSHAGFENPADLDGFADPVGLALQVAYDGTGYSGFAKQQDAGVRTVQGSLEHALGTLLRREVSTVCAGRTDAGVHARGQVVSCVVESAELEAHPARKLLTSLNALTDDDVSVLGVRRAAPTFSARFDALYREYRYRICLGAAPPLFLRRYAWWHRAPLDVEAMREASARLLGEHDFKSFCKTASAQDKNTVRTLDAVELLWEEHLGERCLVVRVVGNAFLHSMVRTIVGTLEEVGSGRRDAAWVAEVLAARSRDAAGRNAPACGLTFWQVEYPKGSFEVLA